jgi:hypothetical protein
LRVAYRDVDEVLTAFDALQARFLDARDRRGVFIAAYVLISRELARRLHAQAFRDDAWVARYLVAFANLYRQALLGYESGGEVPKAWRFAFDAAASGASSSSRTSSRDERPHQPRSALALTAVAIDPERRPATPITPP